MILEKIRKTIQEAAPKAEEKMAYGRPTFILKNNLVHFGAYKNHTRFYPTPLAIAHFQKELSLFETNKGSIKFPLIDEIPYQLITKIVSWGVKENKKIITE